MKFQKLTNASPAEYDWMKQHLDNLPQDELLIFEDWELPPGCIPGVANVAFMKISPKYLMGLDREIHYTGQNEAVRMHCQGRPLPFESFDNMRKFLNLLSLEQFSTPAANPAPKPDYNYDLDSIADTSGLTVPKTAAPPVLDYKIVERELGKIIMGQEMATLTIAQQVTLHLQKKNPKKPLSAALYGPPGTGKSETAKALSRVLSKLSGRQYSDVWTDLNTFTEASSVNRLIGAPPGYVGYDDTPVFESVTRNPYTIFIFDELDKAHPEVLKTFMSILDEGRCAARKELADHSREYDFRNSIILFTSNFKLNSSPKKPNKMGFASSNDCDGDGSVDVGSDENTPEDTPASITNRIFRETEAARKAFVEAGVLPEIASRFSCFVEFKELTAEAKIKILTKQVVETGFEYNVRLTHISSEILQSLINVSTSENVLTVRSFKSIIEGYLAAAFAEAGADCGGQAVRLEGTLETPQVLAA